MRRGRSLVAGLLLFTAACSGGAGDDAVPLEPVTAPSTATTSVALPIPVEAVAVRDGVLLAYGRRRVDGPWRREVIEALALDPDTGAVLEEGEASELPTGVTAEVGEVTWAVRPDGRLDRAGPPVPAPPVEPAFDLDARAVPAGAVLTVWGRGIEPSPAARPLRLVRTGVKPRKVGEVAIGPSGSFAIGVRVDGTPGRYHVAFDHRRAGDFEVVRADAGVTYRVVVDEGCLRFDLRTWPARHAGAATFRLTGADLGTLTWDGGRETITPGDC